MGKSCGDDGGALFWTTAVLAAAFLVMVVF